MWFPLNFLNFLVLRLVSNLLSYSLNAQFFVYQIIYSYRSKFLPENEISDAFVDIIYFSPNDDYTELSRYFLRTYIEGNFKPKIWAQPVEKNISMRTTNGAERFHQAYNSEFY